jgi:hypothetical protein
VSVSVAFLVQDAKAAVGQEGKVEVFIRIEDGRQRKITSIQVVEVVILSESTSLKPTLTEQPKDSPYSASYLITAAQLEDSKSANVRIADRFGGERQIAMPAPKVLEDAEGGAGRPTNDLMFTGMWANARPALNTDADPVDFCNPDGSLRPEITPTYASRIGVSNNTQIESQVLVRFTAPQHCFFPVPTQSGTHEDFRAGNGCYLFLVSDAEIPGSVTAVLARQSAAPTRDVITKLVAANRCP